jgi:hypothetical protein
VPVDVSELADVPYSCRELASEKVKDVAPRELAQHHNGRNVIEVPTVGSSIQLDSEATPSLDFPLLAFGFKHHSGSQHNSEPKTSRRSVRCESRSHVMLRRMRVCRAEADYGLRAGAQSAKA